MSASSAHVKRFCWPKSLFSNAVNRGVVRKASLPFTHIGTHSKCWSARCLGELVSYTTKWIQRQWRETVVLSTWQNRLAPSVFLQPNTIKGFSNQHHVRPTRGSSQTQEQTTSHRLHPHHRHHHYPCRSSQKCSSMPCHDFCGTKHKIWRVKFCGETFIVTLGNW